MTYRNINVAASQLRTSHNMAFGAVQHVQAWASRAAMAAWVVLELDHAGNLCYAEHHLPVAHTMDHLPLVEPPAEGVQGIQLDGWFDGAPAREMRRVRDKDSKGGIQGRQQIHPRQMARDAQIVEGVQQGVPSPRG